MKECTICKKQKEVSEFYKHSRLKDGLFNQCKSCVDARTKKWSEDNRGRVRELAKLKRDKDPEATRKYAKNYYDKNRDRLKVLKKNTRLKAYGITSEEYQSMKVAQDNCCDICGSREPLHIDHDHDTGKVRSLLCSTCNTGLGKFRDSTEMLRKAIDYLNKHGKKY